MKLFFLRMLPSDAIFCGVERLKAAGTPRHAG